MWNIPNVKLKMQGFCVTSRGKVGTEGSEPKNPENRHDGKISSNCEDLSKWIKEKEPNQACDSSHKPNDAEDKMRPILGEKIAIESKYGNGQDDHRKKDPSAK